jgi:hypothetical protein
MIRIKWITILVIVFVQAQACTKRQRESLMVESVSSRETLPVLEEFVWGHSSAGRAPALHAGGRRFDPVWLHQFHCFSAVQKNNELPQAYRFAKPRKL